MIGLILAETQQQAQDAANMVEITYEELPLILTIEVRGEEKYSRAPLKDHTNLGCN